MRSQITSIETEGLYEEIRAMAYSAGGLSAKRYPT